MRQIKRILNFRVTEELLSAIDQLGEKLYPTPARKDSKLNYDRTATLTDVIMAGIQALSDGKIVIHGRSSESNLTTLTEKKVRQMVRQCITESQPESFAEDRVNELISNAISNQTSKIESMVKVLISNAVSNQPNLTELSVKKMISNAFRNQPSLTEVDVRELISSAVSNQPFITEEKVNSLISKTLRKIESNTSAIVEKAITTATAPLLEKISNIESTISTKLDGDKLPSKSTEIDGADRKCHSSDGGKTLYQMEREQNAPCYIIKIYRDGRLEELYNDTPAPRWLCEQYIERARDPRGDADAGLGADPIDYEIKSALHRISDLEAWYREVKKFKEWKPNPQEEWSRRYFSYEIKPEFLFEPTPLTKTEVVSPEKEPLGITSTSLSPIFEEPKENQAPPPAAKVKFPFGLSQTKLAKRLGKASNTVSKSCNKGKTYFKAWSKKYDPDGIAWELRTINNKGKHFSPCAD